MGSYLYHTDQKGQYGDLDWWAPEPNRLFSKASIAKRNNWTAVKQYIKMNTKGVNNGLIEAWANGEKVYSRDGINFTNNDEFREVYRFWLDVYYGGGQVPSIDHDVYFDQFNYSLGSSDKTSVSCN